MQEASEPVDRDREPERPYSLPVEGQLTLPDASEDFATDVFSNDYSNHGAIAVSELSMREAYLIRSYIDKIAAVVSLLNPGRMARGLITAGGYLRPPVSLQH